MALGFLASAQFLPAQTTIVPGGAIWRFFADDSVPGTNWQSVAFDDSAWRTGSAPLGFGEDELATSIASGTGPVTAYFRHTFTVTNRQQFVRLAVRVRRDDGVNVYLNNRLVVQNNLPGGPINYQTRAVSTVTGADESRLIQFGTSPAYLAEGTNVLAVELHQALDGENDAVFDLELVGNLPLSLPTVAITSHHDMDVISPGPMTIRAQAGDLDGHIYWVTFYTNGVRMFTDFAEPYEFTATNMAPGRYRLMAEAVDNSGRRVETAIIRVQVGEVTEDRVLRGPYLQSGTPTGMVVCWRTDWFAQSRVLYGTDPENLDCAIRTTALTTDHAVHLSGLLPHTKYFYAIGTADQVLAGGEDYSFTTAPTNAQPTRVWVIGDSGSAGIYQAMVRDAFRRYAGPNLSDLWLMLGDNAYECGMDGEYQAAVFNVYPEILRRVVLWPTIGNHDAGCYSEPDKFPYLDIFHLPAQGEAGGTASGTEKYYSYDHGNIHFVCLDSQTSSRLPGSAMLAWLEQDLAATEKDWIIAYWHHPPYSFGTHDSDFEYELIEMRQYVVPLLESYGVDLVLSGHSHNYERSYLLNGHYGFSADFTTAFVLDGGSGCEAEGAAYLKPAGGIGANRGTVYTVCGCSGEGGYFTPSLHPAMRVSLTGFGSMILDIDGLRLDAKFLTETGEVADCFTIRKGTPPDDVRPALRISHSSGQTTLSWPTSLRRYRLESRGPFGHPDGWRKVLDAPFRIGRREAVTVKASHDNELFRLKADP